MCQKSHHRDSWWWTKVHHICTDTLSLYSCEKSLFCAKIIICDLKMWPKILHTKRQHTHTITRSNLNTFFWQNTLRLGHTSQSFSFFLYSYLQQTIDDCITLIPNHYFTKSLTNNNKTKETTISFFLYSEHLFRVRFGTTQ